MLFKNWNLATLDKERVSEISEIFEMDPLLSVLFQVRGFSNDQITNFLSKDIELESPMSYIDMDKASQRILQAIRKFEKICVYGDYDTDGVTSTALVYSYLNMSGANVMYSVPDRYEDGYGLNIKILQKLKDEDVDLIITVDNGVCAFDEVEYANSIGIDVVITDHHEVPERLPNAVAVVDPHRTDCMSKFKDLAGVGVAFKLICALENDFNSVDDILSEYGDLVAIGTIGDSVPLLGENRQLVKKGLECIKETQRPGIQSLLAVSFIEPKNVDSTKVAFGISPRINAAGRMRQADLAVKLLLAESSEEANSYAAILEELNSERKKLQQEIFLESEKFLYEHPERLLNRIIVIEGENLHMGVIGIVASRIVNKYSKPCIIISKNGDLGRGSGRSISGFSIYDATKVCEPYMLRFGGHPMAVGFDIATENIDKLVSDVNKYAFDFGDMPVVNLDIECKLKPESLSIDFVDRITELEPFGHDNTTPTFGLFNMTVKKLHPIAGGKHLKLELERGDTVLSVMSFYSTAEDLGIDVGDVIDVAVSLKKDFYNQSESLSIISHGIKLSGVSREDVIENEKFYEAIKRNEITDQQIINPVVPKRDEFAKVYRFLKLNKGWQAPIEVLWFKMKQPDISICKLEFILDILNQVGLIKLKVLSEKYSISLTSIKEKVNLNSSNVFKKLKTLAGG